ncbi:MAG: tRNA (guanine(37)-N(1))-methyltransferase [uncultured Rubrobacteraceae bacterium]|uniref:tRNA (guanine-N(1)-)-methyltransferase n=1 Tax=uncultured Rubrobacteraceae bacterium TaxID=349277 RepID=A0A6J4Q1W3_9ACTN|nr:MAG: tRNA (guanine(37)-N(1))-methyltransferase [uncultured Rubrobacteraceae bacterium]
MKSIDVFCVFPEAVEATVRLGVVGRAIERGLLAFRTFDLREYAPGGRIDDAPFGGGAGMVIRVDVVVRAFEEVYGVPARQVRELRRVVVTEPGGRELEQDYVWELAQGIEGGQGLTVVCGRYGGMDERVSGVLATEAISLGSFVLSGGEIVAAALSDAVIRLLDGALGNSESLVGESFSRKHELGPPQYTRPAVWDGEEVPAVLLSGNHERIRAWRQEEARGRAIARAEAGDGRRKEAE